MDAFWHALGTITVSLRTLLVAVLIVAALALWLGYAMFHVPERQTTETFAPGYTQKDGSRVADRIPTPKDDLPAAPHEIPKKTKEVRRFAVTVKPIDPHMPEPSKPDDKGLCPIPSCLPVTVDMSLVKEEQEEGGFRLVTSSPDGDILSATDIPIIALSPPQPRNAISIMGNKTEGVLSATYSRRFRLFNRPVDAAIGVIHTDTGRNIPVAGGTIHY